MYSDMMSMYICTCTVQCLKLFLNSLSCLSITRSYDVVFISLQFTFKISQLFQVNVQVSPEGLVSLPLTLKCTVSILTNCYVCIFPSNHVTRFHVSQPTQTLLYLRHNVRLGIHAHHYNYSSNI